jgi:photosystem II stability/assembly factor-like uncharacterized protein
MNLYLATDNGILRCSRHSGGWQVNDRALDGRQVTSAIARPGSVIAGTDDGIFRSDDDGRSWREGSTGLTVRHVRWLAHHPARPDHLFAGTEPAAIFVSEDGTATWQERPEVARLRDRHGWFLPYSPEAGCVRDFAFHGSRGYAAVEVGGVLRSDDYGRTWALAPGSDGEPDTGHQPEPQVHADVHSLEVHPSSPDRVYAPTGGGFYTSSDGGATWQFRYDCYCRAAWIDPADADHIILGPADGVDRNGRIESSYDGGRTWQPAATGLKVPWPGHMVERFGQVDQELLALLSNGHLLTSPLNDLKWQQIMSEVSDINAVAVG